jgi:outer membrane murein-binding lipoprotein Lpp
MPSIRDSLRKPRRSDAPDAPEEAIANDDLTTRILQSQELKISLARTEVTRHQARIDQLQSQIDDLHEQQLPPGQLSASLNNAKSQLHQAKDDLSRAEEAKLNTEHAIPRPGKTSIRAALGGPKPAQEATKSPAPKLR